MKAFVFSEYPEQMIEESIMICREYCSLFKTPLVLSSVPNCTCLSGSHKIGVVLLLQT